MTGGVLDDLAVGTYGAWSRAAIVEGGMLPINVSADLAANLATPEKQATVVVGPVETLPVPVKPKHAEEN